MSELDIFSSEDLPDLYEKHWGGMPEFVQEDKTPHRTIMIHFRNEEDVKRFAAVIGIELFERTQSTWYPEMHFFKNGKKCQRCAYLQPPSSIILWNAANCFLVFREKRNYVWSVCSLFVILLGEFLTCNTHVTLESA